MNGSEMTPPADRRLRVWPGVVIVALYWAALKVPGWIMPGTVEQFYISGLGSMMLALAFLVWWLVFSRITIKEALLGVVRAVAAVVRWLRGRGAWLTERLLGLLAFLAIGAAALSLYHPTLRGNRPDAAIFSLVFNVLPVVFAGWIVWLVIARSFRRPARLAGLAVVLMLTWGAFTAFRFDGVTGTFSPEFSLRWQPSAEERLLASRVGKPEASAGASAVAPELTPADWPGFRGPARDGRRPGVRIATDWAQHPPKELWRHPVGPGWGSFAVVGPRLFTQEQLGSEERVVCYDAATGAEVWAHADETRHSDNESGAGPRATPTFHDGRIYALGATGVFNCLDAATGKKLWSRDIAADSGRDAAPTLEDPKVPMWGFSASPLVMNGVVTVFAGGPNGKCVLAYQAGSGEPAWTAACGSDSYCSLQPARIDGVDQLIVATNSGLTAFDPAKGTVLWEHEWKMEKGFARVTQPALVGDADVLIGTGFGFGTRRVHVEHDSSTNNWKTEKVWETRAIAPYFNDLVIHKGHIYGFHSNLFACVDLADGKQKWKERGYDSGQVLLLPDQDLLVIQAEKGDVALVEAKPDRRTEIARISALKAKTWNHPVIAHGKLFVRNGVEAACYQLTVDSGSGAAGK